MLVGDVILLTREQIPDMPPTMGPCTNTSALLATACTLAAGNYFVKITQFNSWGETLPSVEVGPLAVDNAHGIAANTVILPGAVKVRAYIGIVAGGENQYLEAPVVSIPGTPTTINFASPGTGGVPPTRATAYIPDADGQAFAAGTLFRWLTVALREGSRAVGGLPNYSGVSTVAGQGVFTALGEWVKVTDLWYDGYPMALDRRGNFFKRTAVTSSVLNAGSLAILDNRVVFEVWPQAARTGGVSTLAVSMGATDTALTLASTAGFVLPFGLAQITVSLIPNSTEIVAYAGTAGAQLTGLVRGVGGTIATAAPSGTPVTELNLMFHGNMAITTPYAPGTSSSTLPVPSGWDAMLSNYMLAKAATAQGDTQGAQALMGQWQMALQMWARTNRQLAGPQQVTDKSGGRFLTYGDHPLGNTILP